MSALDKYIGEPWTPVENNCWTFARRVWRERFSLDVALLDVNGLDRRSSVQAFRDSSELGQWAAVLHPADGDAVLMGKSSRPSHVGIYVAGRVLHCLEKAGVVYQDVTSLNASGLRVLGYYRHRSRMRIHMDEQDVRDVFNHPAHPVHRCKLRSF
jgi:cell wall-associated NlpC family hydrolase